MENRMFKFYRRYMVNAAVMSALNTLDDEMDHTPATMEVRKRFDWSLFKDGRDKQIETSIYAEELIESGTLTEHEQYFIDLMVEIGDAIFSPNGKKAQEHVDLIINNEREKRSILATHALQDQMQAEVFETLRKMR